MPTRAGNRRTDTDLLSGIPTRRSFAPLVPLGILLVLIVSYIVATLAWPMNSAPTAFRAALPPTPIAPLSDAPWPESGSAAVAVVGMPEAAISTTEASDIASITKVITSLMILEKLPLAVGETGPEYAFTAEDVDKYWQYRISDESALMVPAGGTLTEYQMLQGVLMGSGGNYVQRMVDELWPSSEEFAAAATEWLAANGLSRIQIVEPTGIDPLNSAAPDALLPLGALALQHPVVAEIVATPAVELPGAGLIENTNKLLADPGVVGIKTGTLSGWNLLSAKDVTVGENTVRMIAAVLGQPGEDARTEASRAIYAQVEAELQPVSALTAGTEVGTVDTVWDESATVSAVSDASVVLWNGSAATFTPTITLGDLTSAGDSVGTLNVSGPLTSVDVELTLDEDLDGPSPWWRLTHPLQLFGLAS